MRHLFIVCQVLACFGHEEAEQSRVTSVCWAIDSAVSRKEASTRPTSVFQLEYSAHPKRPAKAQHPAMTAPASNVAVEIMRGSSHM
jgi:hypothetical protein